jgi:hypothetical protein
LLERRTAVINLREDLRRQVRLRVPRGVVPREQRDKQEEGGSDGGIGEGGKMKKDRTGVDFTTSIGGGAAATSTALLFFLLIPVLLVFSF